MLIFNLQLALTFGLQYLDKVTISYAAVCGMRADLSLVGPVFLG